ncbi:MAG: creatininase family protein [Variibacter sp.]
MEIEWMRLSAEALRERAAKNALVLLPVASVEQHGPHLATGVDTILCGEIARRAARIIAAKEPVVVAPTLWCGLAEHHMDFGGTFTLTLETYEAVLRDLCGSLVRHGFKRIVIVNGHGGNIDALKVIVGELARDLGAPIATTTYWVLAENAFKDVLEDQTNVQHACEAETSMMMVAAPDLVDASRLSEAQGPVPRVARPILNKPLHRAKSFKEITASGVLGDARRANKEKGERLLAAAAEALATGLLAGEPWV